MNTTGTAGSSGTLSASDSWSGTIATFKAASTSTLALSGAAAANYTLTGMMGSFEITPAALTITAHHQNKPHGEMLEFGGGSTQFTGTGLLDEETIGSVTLACDGGGASATAGSYPITPSAATGGSFDPNNYTISYVSGILTVEPAAATTFETWATDPAQGLTADVNDGPLDDPDHDGFSNLLEFVLGGEPMVPSQAIRPILTQTGGVLGVFLSAQRRLASALHHPDRRIWRQSIRLDAVERSIRQHHQCDDHSPRGIGSCGGDAPGAGRQGCSPASR